MQRRVFLQGAAAVAGLGSLSSPTEWPFGPAAPTGAPFLDAHAHVNSPRAADMAEQLMKRRVLEPLGGAEVVRRMDAAGIRKSVVNSTAYLIAMDATKRGIPLDQERRELEEDNDYAAGECAGHPDRLIPFLSLNPKRSYAIEEIDRCVDRLGMRGLKLHFWNSLIDTRQPEQLAQVKRALGHAAERNLPVLAHVLVGDVQDYGPDDTERLVKEVIEPLPALRICFAHAAGAGGFGATTQRCLERLVAVAGPTSPLANRVWIDIAAVLNPRQEKPTRERFADLVRRWGVERVFWGSDTFENYLAETRETWPLSDADWEVVCRNEGAGWLGQAR